MKRLLRNFILAFLLLWLPLQGIAAAGMSFCRHDHAPPAAAHAAMQDHHDGHACNHGQDSSAAASQTSCDDCGYCHLGGAPALLPALAALSDDAGFSFESSLSPHFVLFFPEQLQRPPHAFFS